MAHRRAWLPGLAAEIGLGGLDLSRQGVGCALRSWLIPSIRQNRGRRMKDIPRRETGIEGEAEQRIVLARRDAGVDRLRRLDQRALPDAGNEKGNLPERFRRLPL